MEMEFYSKLQFPITLGQGQASWYEVSRGDKVIVTAKKTVMTSEPSVTQCDANSTAADNSQCLMEFVVKGEWINITISATLAGFRL